MLGEGARTWDDAHRYAKSYADAIAAIGRAAGNRPLPHRPGISVKLSALHPRYEPRNREAVLRELVPVLVDLARQAKAYDLNFTVDAEEQDRLELSLAVIETAFADDGLRDWNGFGLAIQGYAKRSLAVIDWAGELARTHGQTLMVRLVKGAYWDTEVKHAQVEGHADYPVFTRKEVTDLNFLACAKRMLALRPHLYAQFATHNALSIAQILETADRTGEAAKGYEFQRLHGMGESLYDAVTREYDATCRIYAPVGGHRDLLAYLVRRLLENGASTSFVAKAGDKDVPVDEVLHFPDDLEATPRHPRIPMPNALFGGRLNSGGMEWGKEDDLNRLADAMRAAPQAPEVAPLTAADVDAAMARAAKAAPAWRDLPAATRSAALRRAADLLEEERPALMATLAREAGKTVDDGIAEIREAVDFLRFYADEAEILCTPRDLPGPTGESNRWHARGRGVFVTVAPWNFPLAIFLGPDRRSPLGRQRRRRQARAADPAHRRPGARADAPRRRPEGCAHPRPRRRRGRTGADGASRPRRRLLHRLDGDRQGDQPRPRRSRRPHRASHRRDRRRERDDRGRDRPARTGGARRGRLRLPLRRPALLRLPHPLRAGRRGGPDAGDDPGCRRDPRDGRRHGSGDGRRARSSTSPPSTGSGPMSPTTNPSGRARHPTVSSSPPPSSNSAPTRRWRKRSSAPSFTSNAGRPARSTRCSTKSTPPASA